MSNRSMMRTSDAPEFTFAVTQEDVVKAGYTELQIARMSAQRMSFEDMLCLKEAEESTEELIKALSQG